MSSKRPRPAADDAAAAASSSYHDVICLDVGGTRFHTNRATLTSTPGSMLAARFGGGAMMAGGELPRDTLRDCPVYFIDRSADSFPHILHFLRVGQLSPQIKPFHECPGTWRQVV